MKYLPMKQSEHILLSDSFVGWLDSIIVINVICVHRLGDIVRW